MGVRRRRNQAEKPVRGENAAHPPRPPEAMMMKDRLSLKMFAAAFAAFAIAGLSLPLAATAMAETSKKKTNPARQKIPVILDTDIGDDIDDTWALVLALKCPELDIKLVAGDYGRSRYRAKLIAKLLETADRTDIPVGVGIEIDKPAPEISRQQEWIAGYDLANYPGTVHQDGVQAIIDTIMNSPEPITVIAVGPVPNLRAALEREPRITGKAKFVGMHGSIRKGYGGRAEISPEWNVKADPKAARAVLSAAWDVTITPLDTCQRVVLEGDRYAAIHRCADPLVRALMENYRIWWKNHDRLNPEGDTTRPQLGSSILYDTVAVYLAFSQELCKMETLSVRVDDKGFTRIDPAGKSMSVATKWRDLPKFGDFLVERLTGAPTPASAPRAGEDETGRDTGDGTGAGDIVFRTGFDRAEDLTDRMKAVGKLADGYRGSPSLLLENRDRDRRSTEFSVEIPAAMIAGQVLDFRAMIKAEGIRANRNDSRAGVQFMLSLDTEHGTSYVRIPHVWHPLPAGDFDWTAVAHLVRVPENIRRARLVAGLTNATGKLWFDNLDLRRAGPAPVTPPAKSKTVFTGHDLDRLRGVMIGDFDEENFRVLAEDWKANQIRVPLALKGREKQASRKAAPSLDAYDRWLEGRLAKLDRTVDAAGRHGIKVLPSLHYTPGGRTEKGLYQRLFEDRRYQEKYIEVWQRIARRYKGREVVYAYDILNEPLQGPRKQGLQDWPELAVTVIDSIRAIDPGKPIVFELGPWGKCLGYDGFQPLPRDRVIYSFHLYQPHAFSHQGVGNNPVKYSYPGVISGEMWNKERLRETMRPIIEFQKRHGVQIYVGEFSAPRWSPQNSTWRWLRDAIDLFEEHRWDWSYHAYREWDGWSVEHSTDQKDKAPSPVPTDRQELLTGWFAKNAELVPGTKRSL